MQETEIFTRSRDRPRLASAHHKPDGGPPKICKGEHLKLGLKFSVLTPITLRVVVITSQNFTRCVARGGGDNVDTNFGRGAPNKIWEGKKRPKFGVIIDNFRL